MVPNLPHISIVMPVYNADPFLDECLSSIVAQSFTNWELIVVNDFSTDSSEKILQKWTRKDARINCFQNLSKGIIPALSLAFNKSKGKFITRMDGDDIMPVRKLELFANHSLKYPRAIVTGKVSYFADSGVSDGYLRYENWLNDRVELNDFWSCVYRECVIASPNWMVARDCFERLIRLEDLSYPEDYDMVLKWYEHRFEIQSIQEITHLWREHPKRTSRNSPDYQQRAFFKLKTQRFIDLEWMPNEPLQLIGASVKGKLVAKELNIRKVGFKWFDFNARKSGNTKVMGLNEINKGVKTIVTVWPEDNDLRNNVLDFLSENELVFGRNCWLF